MPRRFFQKYMPKPHEVRDHKALQWIAHWLHDPNLWHLNRHSVSRGFAVGLFVAFLPIPPIPGQSVVSAVLAVWLRVNLPIAVALVWITNPLTMAPVFYAAYEIGHWILDTPPIDVKLDLTWEWFTTVLVTIWKPFLLGSVVISAVASFLGYWGIQIFWRAHVTHRYVRRRRERRETKRERAGAEAAVADDARSGPLHEGGFQAVSARQRHPGEDLNLREHAELSQSK